VSEAEETSETESNAGGGWLRYLGWLLAAAAVGFAALTYFGVGVPPGAERAWYEPSGFLDKALSLGALSDVVADLATARMAFGLVSIALAVAIFATTSSAVARYLAVASALTIQVILYYALEADGVWTFFKWRWGGSMILFSLVVAAALTAPILGRGWLRLGWPLRLVVFLPLLALVLFIERNVTGTDQNLSFAISPWPVVQVFGIEVLATIIASLVLGTALGLYGLHLAQHGRGPSWLAPIAGAAAAATLPAVALWLGSINDLLPFTVTSQTLVSMGALGLLVFLAATIPTLAARLLGRSRTPFGERARVWAVGAALVLIPAVSGQLWARMDYSTTREDRAQRVIDALLAYYKTELVYPDSLDELVDAQLIAAVPRPTIGFGSDQHFVYQNFGDSFILEFSSPRWIQCAYNPPYPEELEEGYEPEEGEDGGYEDDSGGAWSCPSKPPELW